MSHCPVTSPLPTVLPYSPLPYPTPLSCPTTIVLPDSPLSYPIPTVLPQPHCPVPTPWFYSTVLPHSPLYPHCPVPFHCSVPPPLSYLPLTDRPFVPVPTRQARSKPTCVLQVPVCPPSSQCSTEGLNPFAGVQGNRNFDPRTEMADVLEVSKNFS